MKTLCRHIAIVALLLASSTASKAQTSAYSTSPSQVTLTIGPNGGILNVPYMLTSGPEVAGIGQSFTLTFEISGLSGTGHIWDDLFSSSPWIGGIPNIASLASNLPENNLGPHAIPQSDFSFQAIASLLVDQSLDVLGSYSITTPELPVAPEGYFISSEYIQLAPFWHHGSDQPSSAGLVGLPKDSNGNYMLDPVNYASHGSIVSFDYSAYGNIAAVQGFVTLGYFSGFIEFSAVPEPSSALLVGIAGLTLMRRNRRRIHHA
jgi:hypothetical protein